jgi:hypothetical protein
LVTFKDAAPIAKPVEKKKPTSPFFLFFMEKRRELLAEQPHLITPEVGRYGTVENGDFFYLTSSVLRIWTRDLVLY